MTQTGEYQGPLAGLNVIDFGHYYAGPMVGMLLADQGANVIRVIRPGEPELPEPQYRLYNRNKKLLTLDLKTPEGKERAKSLIERADVVIENFRPGVMKRLGLDYSSVNASNPGLIYLSLPGFASTDKERAHTQAWEGILSAAACVYTELSECRQFLGYPPLYTSIPFCSSYGAMNGAMAIMAALVAREQYGVGTQLEVPLADAGMTAFEGDFFGKKPFYTLRAQTDPNSLTDIPLPPALKDCAYSAKDTPEATAKKLESARQQMMSLYFMYKLYPCADGREIYIYLSYSFANKLLKVLGIDKQIKSEGFIIEDPWEPNVGNNIGSFGSGLTAERKERLMELIGQALLTKPAEEWESLMTRAGVHAAMVKTRDEWLGLEAHQESGFLTRMGKGDAALTLPGRLTGVIGPEGALTDDTSLEPELITLNQAKTLFESFTPREISTDKQKSLKKGDLLKGLKVVDFGNFVAGPTIAVHLAGYGAEVIKADAPRYDFHAGVLILLTNQGKRSILTDLTSAPGREIFQRLVSQADVVTHNSVDGTAERLGATYRQLKAINPGIVVAQMGAYCGPERGGWGTRGGNEPLIQASCGVMTQYGTPEEAHRCGQIAIGDVPGGYCGAFATLLGVYHQRRTGQGSECRTSLGQVANYVQLPFMIAKNGKSDWGEACGQLAVGESWWQRLYRCSDGWIYVGTSKDRTHILAETVVGQKVVDEKVLETVFAEQACDYWLKKLKDADIACHRTMSVEDIFQKTGVKQVDNQTADETAKGASEILCWNDHPSGTPFTLPAPDCVRVGENHSYRRVIPAPRLGEHTIQILRELNYAEEEIAEFIRIRAAHEYFPPLRGKDAYLYPVQERK